MKPSTPAMKTAGAGPYQQATSRTIESEGVNVTFSCANFKPAGRGKTFGKTLAVTTNGTRAKKINSSRSG